MLLGLLSFYMIAFAEEPCQSNQVYLYSSKPTIKLGQDYDHAMLEYRVELYEPSGKRSQSLIYDGYGSTLKEQFENSGGYKIINENYTIDTEKLIQTIPNMTDYLRRGWFLKITHGYYWESAELMSENSCYLTTETSGVESLLIKEYGAQLKRELEEKKYTECYGTVETINAQTKLWLYPEDFYVFNDFSDEVVHLDESLIRALDLVSSTPEGIAVININNLKNLPYWNNENYINLFVGHNKAGCGFYCAFSPNQKLRQELGPKLETWANRCDHDIYNSTLNNIGK